MNFRSILVHLDASPRCEARAALAVGVAHEHGAHLLGLAPTGMVELTARVTPSRTGEPNYLEFAQARLNERAAQWVSALRARAAGLGLTACDGRVVEEDALAAMLKLGRCSDLIVCGQRDPGVRETSAEDDLGQQLLIRTGRPVLVMPYAGNFDTVGRRVVVAWNDSRESARAVHDALPFLCRAQSVCVLCFDRPGEPQQVTRLQLNDLRAWFARHGVDAAVQAEQVPIDVGDALLARACDLGADLIVMGGYGHSRMREFVLGGTTRTLLEHMTVPVLFAH